jgi:hypothetical protein
MNHSYVTAFRSYRDEFKKYKQSPSVNNVINTALMDQSSTSSGLSAGSATREAAASQDLSSSSQCTTLVSMFPSDSLSTIAQGVSATDIDAAFNDSEALNSSPEEEVQEPENWGSSAPSVTLPPQRSRKGHKKSRQGCYNCKRRKIKVRASTMHHSRDRSPDRRQCQETQPECENCTRKNMKCDYPAPKTLSELQASASYASSPISAVTLQSTPTQFTLTDLRLFHHFLMTAYPHLPVGNDNVWLCQVPLLAHHVSRLLMFWQPF